jgi:hypothetical protein
MTLATNAPATGTSQASATDLLTALQNVVKALTAATTAYLNVNGLANTLSLSVPTVVKSSAGRVATVSVTIAGSTTGGVFDGNHLGNETASRLLFVIPNTVGVTVLNMPTSYGLLIVPGTAQAVAVSYS